MLILLHKGENVKSSPIWIYCRFQNQVNKENNRKAIGVKGEERAGRQQKKYALKWFSSIINGITSKSFYISQRSYKLLVISVHSEWQSSRQKGILQPYSIREQSLEIVVKNITMQTQRTEYILYSHPSFKFHANTSKGHSETPILIKNFLKKICDVKCYRRFPLLHD